VKSMVNQAVADEGELVAYCGLHCGDCLFHRGFIADLARDLRKELRQSRFDLTAKVLADSGFFKVFSNYDECYEVLGGMVKLRCNKGCRKGGGSPQCKVRKCCQIREMKGCWECEIFENCEKLDFLRRNHGEAHMLNLRRLRKNGVEGFVEGKHDWYVKEKN